MSHSESSLPPNENLPPVEPPSAGFLVQLFVIPAVIVLIIVLVWTLFSWLAQKGNDADAYVEALQRDNLARWQAAVSLADLVRSSGDEGIRRDAKIALKLRDILEKELATGRTDQASLQLRSYLCNSLGEFRVPGLLPVLVQSADTKTSDESPVRFAALKAIAVYLEANPDQRNQTSEKLFKVLEAAAEDEQPLMRSTAAFAYGALNTKDAQVVLQRMLTDISPDVRYNAALTLARRGQPAAIAVLIEMLDPGVSAGIEAEKDESSRDAKRSLILVNALRAAESLHRANSQIDFTKLNGAIDKLRHSDVPQAIKIQAAETLQQLSVTTKP